MSMPSNTVFGALVLAPLISLSPIAVQACDFGYCWGAVGIGPDGVAGHSTMQPTLPDAERQAQVACGEKCTTIEVFHDSCAALAVTQEYATVVGFGKTRSEATEQALESCRDADLYCTIRDWACSLER